MLRAGGSYSRGTCPGSQWCPRSTPPTPIRPVNYRSALPFSAPFPGTVCVLFVPLQLTLKCFKLFVGPNNAFSQACTLTLVQFSRSVVSDSLRPHESSTPGLPVPHRLPEFTQTHVHRVSDAISPLILCRPLLLLPPIPPSIRVFSNESTLHEVAKVLEFQL